MVNKVRAPQRPPQRPPKPPQRAPQRVPQTLASEEEATLAKELDDTLARLDAGIAEERKHMAELLARLRTTRVAA
jgi:hypothetical protein